jgi:hypothetical protein
MIVPNGKHENRPKTSHPLDSEGFTISISSGKDILLAVAVIIQSEIRNVRSIIQADDHCQSSCRMIIRIRIDGFETGIPIRINMFAPDLEQ